MNESRLSFDQSFEENRAAFIARLIDAGWQESDARKEWERIQNEPED